MLNLPPARAVSAGVQPVVRQRYLWGIAAVAALGGFLFGDDWAVIGGAKPFYEVFFGLHSSFVIGWANSCALTGCFAGALGVGRLSQWLGRRPVLLLSALLFAVSSLCTGWAHSFLWFISWRIGGGIAIGLASNISPVYIAEISPAAMRGRLVALNQLTLVCGILAAQITNWQIARPIPAHMTVAASYASWNVQDGWRWMFTSVAAPAILFFCLACFIPESPRWLVQRGKATQAQSTLERIGGEAYAALEMQAIRRSFAQPGTEGKVSEWRALLGPRLRKLLLLGIALAVLQQWSGINILFNYAQEIYEQAGYGVSQVLFNIVITGVINLFFTIVSLLLVDRAGRRILMITGFLGVGMAHLAASAAYKAHMHGIGVLLLTLLAIAFYAATIAPVTWVLIAELFPNAVRDAAVSIAVAALWASSFALTYSFPPLAQSFGIGTLLLGYGGLCLAGAALVYLRVPETCGRSLETM